MSLTGPSGDSTMDAQEKLKELYLRALAMETTERDLLLQREAADSATREEILRLLSYSGQAARYFSRLSKEEIETLVRIEPLLECGEVLAGRFAILRFLARGGMGEVYEAADRELGGRLALKVMRPGIVEHAGGLQRFRDEIRLGREVNNPHVCRVFDVARHTGGGRDLIFFTMELLEGATLSDRLQREEPLPLPDARNVIRQMAAGLDAAIGGNSASRFQEPQRDVMRPANRAARSDHRLRTLPPDGRPSQPSARTAPRPLTPLPSNWRKSPKRSDPTSMRLASCSTS